MEISEKKEIAQALIDTFNTAGNLSLELRNNWHIWS